MLASSRGPSSPPTGESPVRQTKRRGTKHGLISQDCRWCSLLSKEVVGSFPSVISIRLGKSTSHKGPCLPIYYYIISCLREDNIHVQADTGAKSSVPTTTTNRISLLLGNRNKNNKRYVRANHDIPWVCGCACMCCFHSHSTCSFVEEGENTIVRRQTRWPFGLEPPAI